MNYDRPFTNTPIVIGDVPRVSDRDLQPVNRCYLIGRLMSVGLTALIATAIGGIIAARVNSPTIPLLLTAGTVLIVLILTVFTVLETRRLGFMLREHDISLRSGIMTHRVATMPLTRVQHVSLRRGPFERILGLATVEINSAGPDLSIPGLALNQAEYIKDVIAERAGVNKRTNDREHHQVNRETLTDPSGTPT